MASLKCSKCGNGIHYHDEPDGTEWIAFEINTWKELISSPLEVSSYKTEMLSGWYTIWKCEECGSIHVFNSMETSLHSSYSRTELVECEDNIDTAGYIVFEDTVWDEITETDETGTAFSGSLRDIPRKYAVKSESVISVYLDLECTKLERQYMLLQRATY